MTRKPGITKNLKDKAKRAGTDIDNLDRRTKFGNKLVQQILAYRQSDSARSVLRKGRKFVDGLKQKLPLLSAVGLTTIALMTAAEAQAAVGSGVMASPAGQIVQFLDGVDWWKTSVTGLLVFHTVRTAHDTIKKWKTKTPREKAAAVANLVDQSWLSGILPGLVPTIQRIVITIEIKRKRANGNLRENAQTKKSNKERSTEPADPEPARCQFHIRSFAASRKGKFRSENQDAFELTQTSDGLLAVVADGVGGAPGGKVTAQNTARAVTDFTLRELAQKTDHMSELDCLENAIEKTRTLAEEENWPGMTTLIMAYIKGDRLWYATLGDGGLAAIYPGGIIAQFLVPHHRTDKPVNVITGFIGRGCDVPARIGTTRLEPESIIFAYSDGCDLLDFEELANRREQLRAVMQTDAPMDAIAGDILLQLEEARDENGSYKHSDNMTLAMALLSEDQSSDSANA